MVDSRNHQMHNVRNGGKMNVSEAEKKVSPGGGRAVTSEEMELIIVRCITEWTLIIGNEFHGFLLNIGREVTRGKFEKKMSCCWLRFDDSLTSGPVDGVFCCDVV